MAENSLRAIEFIVSGRVIGARQAEEKLLEKDTYSAFHRITSELWHKRCFVLGKSFRQELSAGAASFAIGTQSGSIST
jgi:predicted cupin superfamily sugar epimerase